MILVDDPSTVSNRNLYGLEYARNIVEKEHKNMDKKPSPPNNASNMLEVQS